MEPLLSRAEGAIPTAASSGAKQVVQSPVLSSSDTDTNRNNNDAKKRSRFIFPLCGNSTPLNDAGSHEEKKLRCNADAARSTTTPQLTLTVSSALPTDPHLRYSPQEAETQVTSSMVPEVRGFAATSFTPLTAVPPPPQLRPNSTVDSAQCIVPENNADARISRACLCNAGDTCTQQAASHTVPTIVVESYRRASGTENQLTADAARSGDLGQPEHPSAPEVFVSGACTVVTSYAPLPGEEVSCVSRADTRARFAGTADIFASPASYVYGTTVVPAHEKQNGEKKQEGEEAEDEAAIQAAIEAAACFEDFSSGDDDDTAGRWALLGSDAKPFTGFFNSSAPLKEIQQHHCHCSSNSSSSSSGGKNNWRSNRAEVGTVAGTVTPAIATIEQSALCSCFGSVLGSTAGSCGTSAGRENGGRHNTQTPPSARACGSGSSDELCTSHHDVALDLTAFATSQETPQFQQQRRRQKHQQPSSKVDGTCDAVQCSVETTDSNSVFPPHYVTSAGIALAAMRTTGGCDSATVTSGSFFPGVALQPPPQHQHQRQLSARTSQSSTGYQSGRNCPSAAAHIIGAAAATTAAMFAAAADRNRSHSFSASSLTSPPSPSLPLNASTSYRVPSLQQQHQQRWQHVTRRPSRSQSSSGSRCATTRAPVTRRSESGSFVCMSPPPFDSFDASSTKHGMPTYTSVTETTAVAAADSQCISTVATARATAVSSLLSSPRAPALQVYQMPQSTLAAEQQQPQEQHVNSNVLLYSPPQAYERNTTAAAVTPSSCDSSLTAPLAAYHLPAATQQREQNQPQESQQITAGCTLTPSFSVSAAAVAGNTSIQSSRASRNLYFRNLPRSWNTTVLRELCSKYGAVMSAKVAHHPMTNESLGYGFVLFESTQSAALCLAALNHALVRAEGEETRTLLVRTAHPSAAPGFQVDPEEAMSSRRTDGSNQTIGGQQQQQQQVLCSLSQAPPFTLLTSAPSNAFGSCGGLRNVATGGSSVFSTANLAVQPTCVKSLRSRNTSSVGLWPLSPMSVTIGSSHESSAIYAPEMRQPYTRSPPLADAAEIAGTVRIQCHNSAGHEDYRGDLPSVFYAAPNIGVSTFTGANSNSSPVSTHTMMLSPPGASGVSNSLFATGPPSLLFSPTQPPQYVPPLLQQRPFSARSPGTLRGMVASPLSLSPNAESGLLSLHQGSHDDRRSSGNTSAGLGPPLSPRSTAAAATSTHNVYINNLPPSWNTTRLCETCAQFGPIVSANVARHPKTNESRGYGFVLFIDENDAAACVRGLHNYHVADTGNVLSCRFARNKATPSIAQVTSAPIICNTPSLHCSDTDAQKAGQETRKELPGAVSVSFTNTEKEKDVAAATAGDPRQRTTASSSSIRGSVLMPIEVFSTLQERINALGMRCLLLQQQQYQRTKTPGYELTVEGQSNPQTPQILDKSVEAAATITEAGRATGESGSGVKTEFSSAQLSALEEMIQRRVVYGTHVPRHGFGCVRPAEATTLSCRSPHCCSPPCTQTSRQVMMGGLTPHLRPSTESEGTIDDSSSAFPGVSSSGRSGEPNSSTAWRTDAFGNSSGDLVCTYAIPIPSRMRSLSASALPTGMSGGNASLKHEDHYDGLSSSNESRPNENVGVLLNAAATTPPLSVGSMSAMSERWYTCTLFASTAAAERFLHEAAEYPGVAATTTATRTGAASEYNKDNSDALTATPTEQAEEAAVGGGGHAEETEEALQMRFGLRDQVIVFNGAPKTTNTAAIGSEGARTRQLRNALETPTTGITPLQQPPPPLPPPYLSAHESGGATHDVHFASGSHTTDPLLLHVTSTSNITDTTSTLPCGGEISAGALHSYPIAPTTAATYAECVTIANYSGQQQPGASTSVTTIPPRRVSSTTQPQLPSPPASEYLLLSSVSTSFPQRGNAVVNDFNTTHPPTVAAPTTTTSFTTHSLNSPPSSNSTIVHPPIDSLTSSLSQPIPQNFACRGSNNGIGHVGAYAVASVDGHIVSALPAFPSFGERVAPPTPAAFSTSPPTTLSFSVGGTAGVSAVGNATPSSTAVHNPPSASSMLMLGMSGGGTTIANATSPAVTTMPHLSVSDRTLPSGAGALLSTAAFPYATSALTGNPARAGEALSVPSIFSDTSAGYRHGSTANSYQ